MSQRILTASLVLGSSLLLPSIAHATLDACGDAYVAAGATCEAVPVETCETRCEPVTMQTSCAAALYTSCETQCVEASETTCTEACAPVCVTECEPAQASASPPHSRGLCMSHCQQTCNDTCAGAENVGRCRASCAHNCAKKCQKTCGEDDQAVACDEKCQTVCTGTCTAESTRQCQVDCQQTSFATCETTHTQRCVEHCDASGGAIFCDGQFLDATDVNACATQIRGSVDADFEFTLTADVDVVADVNTTRDDGGTGIGCSVTPLRGDASPFALLALAAVALGGMARRRARP